MTLEELVGERLMIGIPGTAVRDEDIRLFQDTRAAGLILYRRNFESPAQLVSLLMALEEALGRRPHPQHAGRGALRLPEALPRQGALAPRRAPPVADDRLDLGGDARHAPATLSRRDRGGGRLRDDLAPPLPAA